MKLAIMQPYFFPYIGYWQLIRAADLFLIYDDVNYIKNGWINRNRILIDGKPRYITVDLRGASSNKLISETQLLDNPSSRIRITKTLKQYYSKAPYFSQTYPLIEKLVLYDQNNLAQYLEYIILQVCFHLNITTTIQRSSEIPKNAALKGQERVIEICEIFGADQYLNPVGGQNLYSKQDFLNCGIELEFLKVGDIRYSQFTYPFVPNLSIIDVMMHNPTADIQEMLGMFEIL